jgi:hypothetical protein
LDVFTNNPTTFFINGLTWCEQQRATKGTGGPPLSILHFLIIENVDGFIENASRFHLEAGCYLRERFFLSLEFYRV